MDLTIRKYALFGLLIPIVIAYFALNGFGFAFKAGVPLSCALIIGLVYRNQIQEYKSVWYVIGALIFSAAGDWFLSFKGDSFVRFALGIALYFVAHVGYLGFALANGKMHKLLTIVLTTAYLLLFFFVLLPAIDEPVLLGAVFLYLLISCISLGAAGGIQLKPIVKWSYFSGIALILISDTIIAFHEFVSYQNLSFLILPTYYGAHVIITCALILFWKMDGKTIAAKIVKENY